MDNQKYTNLTGGSSNFQNAMVNGFGIITVMDAYVFNAPSTETFATLTSYDVVKRYMTQKETHPDYICTLDTLKVANVTQEGPTKTVSGGKYSNPLIKFGKSARLEMQDALGSAKGIAALSGGVREWNANGLTKGLHFGEDFQSPKMIIGDTFVMDRKTGQQVPVIIVFYQFLPDSVFNLTQDAEGDATVFDMNGDLLTTLIRVGNADNGSMTHGVFYSIIDPELKVEKTQYVTLTSEEIVKNTTNNNLVLVKPSINVGETGVLIGSDIMSVSGDNLQCGGISLTIEPSARSNIRWIAADADLNDLSKATPIYGQSIPANTDVYFVVPLSYPDREDDITGEIKIIYRYTSRD